MTRRKKILLSILLIFLTYFVICYHSEDKKYKIISEILNDIGLKPSYIWHTPKVIEYDSKAFGQFSFFDKLSVYSQTGIQHMNAFLKSGNEIKPGKIIYKGRNGKISSPEISLIRSEETKFVKDGHLVIYAPRCDYNISMPLLSFDNKTAVMEIEESCDGGSGSIYILKKIDGKWKVIEEILQWIS